MFNHFYLQQLSNLRKKAAAFSRTHPSIAPLLRENSTDPDVERLLEGTAFLSAILHEKIEDDTPEFIRSLAELLFPHILRPLPSSCILSFTPKVSLLDTIKVPSGITVASIPVDGTTCQFRTSMDVTILPLKVTKVKRIKSSETEDTIIVSLSLGGFSLSDWKSDSLTFYAGGDYTQAASFFMHLFTGLNRINLSAGSSSITLARQHLSAPSFTDNSLLFTAGDQNYCRYSILTEYFVLPEKFLFYTITGLGKLCTFGNGSDFELRFHLKTRKNSPEPTSDLFTLFAVPVVNIFHLEAEPIRVDHTQDQMPLVPSCSSREHYDIYTVQSVTGFTQGTVERREYEPYNKFTQIRDSSGFYQIHHSNSPVHNNHEVSISLSYDSTEQFAEEVLSIDLLCTNAHLPSKLKTGDICVPTLHSPEGAAFQNITAPTSQVDVLLEKNELWRLLSHFSTNLLPVSNVESLKELLRIYTFHNHRSDTTVLNNLRKIDAIDQYVVEPLELIIKGILMRGMNIRISFNESNFANAGDAYLFFTVLEHFFSLYASINTFTRMISHNVKTGEEIVWPPRIGEKSLI
jgi:type VI secretion system protein ImpG